MFCLHERISKVFTAHRLLRIVLRRRNAPHRSAYNICYGRILSFYHSGSRWMSHPKCHSLMLVNFWRILASPFLVRNKMKCRMPCMHRRYHPNVLMHPWSPNQRHSKQCNPSLLVPSYCTNTRANKERNGTNCNHRHAVRATNRWKASPYELTVFSTVDALRKI